MLDWLNQLLTSGDTNFLFETYRRYSEWFIAIQARYPGTGSTSHWSTQSAYVNAMQSYSEWTWHMAILALIAFIVCGFFFYKIASSFVGFWRMR